MYSFHLIWIILIIYNVAIIPATPSQQESLGQVKRDKRSVQPCSKFKFEGYHCIPAEKCGHDYYEIDPNNEVSRDQIRSVATLLNTVNVNFDPSEYYCESETDVCCRKADYFGQVEPIVRSLTDEEYDCDDFTNFGYDCVDELICGDDGYYEDGTSVADVLPRSTFSFASVMSCQCTDRVRKGFESLVCCRKASFFGRPEPPGIHIYIYIFLFNVSIMSSSS